MATPDIAPFNKYIGNGATTQFSVGFPYIDTDFIHVYIKRADSDQEEVETTDWEWVNETTIRFPATGSSEAILADGEVLVVQRETPTESEFTFANQKRLFPEDVMKADDLEMQILQEQARDLARAIKVEPTSPVDPEELVNEVERMYQSIDNIDAVARNISDVGTVASNISDVGTVANDIASVNNVSQNMSDVNNVSDNMSDVSTVSTNMSAINDCADNMAAILAAPAEAEKARIWAEGDDEEVVPLGGTHSAKEWAKQEANNYRVKATGSTTFRALKDRFADAINVKDFGAVGDGITDDTAAIQAMITSKGYALFPAGTFKCSTTTIDAPMFFDVGGALTVSSGNTVTITNDIESSNQYILRGDGNYVFDRDTNSGQNSSQIHISWFGVFPNLHKGQSDDIQRALNSISSRTEGVVDFDVGTYRLDKTITVPRGVWIRGQGIRRTAFTNYGSDITLFQTGDVACRFSDIQFENEDNYVIRNNPQIHIKHANCDIFDVVVGRSNKNIVVDANLCRIDRVVYVFNVSGGSGSSVISIRGGNNKVQNVSGLSLSSYGPEAIVRLEGGQTLYSATIQNISCDSPSIAVYVDATAADASNVAIRGVRCNSGSEPCAIQGVSDNGHYIRDIAILDVMTSSNPKGISFTSNYDIQNLRIDDVEFNNATTGIELIKTSGVFSKVYIGANIGLNNVATPYSITNVSDVSYGLTTNTGLMGAINVTINDDSVYTLDLDDNLYQRFFYLCNGVYNYYLGVVRLASNPNQTTISKSSDVDVVTTALTGTTGTDGHLTIGLQQKKLYIENRLGAAKSVTFGFLGGIF